MAFDSAVRLRSATANPGGHSGQARDIMRMVGAFFPPAYDPRGFQNEMGEVFPARKARPMRNISTTFAAPQRNQHRRRRTPPATNILFSKARSERRRAF